jgi:hypothetical protein
MASKSTYMLRQHTIRKRHIAEILRMLLFPEYHLPGRGCFTPLLILITKCKVSNDISLFVYIHDSHQVLFQEIALHLLFF